MRRSANLTQAGKPTVRDLQVAPQHARVTGAAPGAETVADRRLSSDGQGQKFDDNIDHEVPLRGTAGS